MLQELYFLRFTYLKSLDTHSKTQKASSKKLERIITWKEYLWSITFLMDLVYYQLRRIIFQRIQIRYC